MKIRFLSLLLLFVTIPTWAFDRVIPPSPFEKSKVILGSYQKLNEKSQLAALLDMDCVREKGLGVLSKFQSELEIQDLTPHLDSHLKVFKMYVKKAISIRKLREFALSSSCLIGISEDAEYKANFTDPLFPQQTHHSFLKTEEFYNKAAWLPVADSEKAVVAVIDTGVDYRHTDLNENMFRVNGQMVGASFVTGISDFLDDHGHGTHVAGLAAAQVNNGIGGLGTCGQSCAIMPVKVLNAQGSGTTVGVVNGVFWAIDHGAHVLNLSLSRTLNLVGMAPMDLESFRYAMKKNVFVVVAAGNEGAVLSMNGSQSWPTMMAELPGVVSVASLDAATGALSTFSNRSSRYIEIAAPGSTRSTGGIYVGLLSTAMGGGYTTMSGTSMATPIVAGSVGLILSHHQKFKIPYDIWDIEAYLKAGTTSRPDLNTFVEAGRMLNLSVLADKLQTNIDHPFQLDISEAIQGFVVDLYYAILRRNYDVTGATFYLGLMEKNKYPLENMMMSFYESAEFVTNFGKLNDRENFGYSSLMKDHFISDSFLTILGRLPQKPEMDYWSSYLDAFKNKHRILLRVLLNTAEFLTRVKGTRLEGYPRFAAGAPNISERCVVQNFRGDLSRSKQVDFAYCMALERTPDATGKAFYLDLMSKGFKLEDVFLAMFRSPEFQNIHEISQTTDRQFVNILYYLILQRLPAPHEASFWIDVLQRQTRDEVLVAFIYSNEFQQLLISKDIRR